MKGLIRKGEQGFGVEGFGVVLCNKRKYRPCVFCAPSGIKSVFLIMSIELYLPNKKRGESLQTLPSWLQDVPRSVADVPAAYCAVCGIVEDLPCIIHPVGSDAVKRIICAVRNQLIDKSFSTERIDRQGVKKCRRQLG